MNPNDKDQPKEYEPGWNDPPMLPSNTIPAVTKMVKPKYVTFPNMFGPSTSCLLPGQSDPPEVPSGPPPRAGSAEAIAAAAAARAAAAAEAAAMEREVELLVPLPGSSGPPSQRMQPGPRPPLRFPSGPPPGFYYIENDDGTVSCSGRRGTPVAPMPMTPEMAAPQPERPIPAVFLTAVPPRPNPQIIRTIILESTSESTTTSEDEDKASKADMELCQSDECLEMLRNSVTNFETFIYQRCERFSKHREMEVRKRLMTMSDLWKKRKVPAPAQEGILEISKLILQGRALDAKTLFEQIVTAYSAACSTFLVGIKYILNAATEKRK